MAVQVCKCNLSRLSVFSKKKKKHSSTNPLILFPISPPLGGEIAQLARDVWNVPGSEHSKEETLEWSVL